ncbi:endonuclease/exonuclease/phosphatase family protein [Ponticoccus sp. (in: a-proteobacteria)]|uniref:endonuclease/exonuclease/phosphatase family protein n=1 Tax=Ponticoccus sp. (in: a-proteobacteria) TaxID=1925025 RepID=UPI003AB44CF0
MLALAASAEPVRLATWHGDFSRKGPGLLLKELESGGPDLSTILGAEPDVLLLTDFDYDAGAAALGALQRRLKAGGLDLPHRFAARPNTGRATGLDLDGDGLLGGPRDAQGFGWFSGQGGMAVLARWPISLAADRSATLWKDLPDSAIAADDPGFAVQRLSSTAHWRLTVALPGMALTLLTLAATPPVFDGPEDRNGRRNRDEVLLWIRVLDGALGPAPEGPVILLGNFNVDPKRGDGRHEVARRVLSHPRLRDPHPGTDTVTWYSTGPMRVSYVLPDKALPLAGAGITPPSPDPALGPHRLVWIDIARP